jgi:hypothetical protein
MFSVMLSPQFVNRAIARKVGADGGALADGGCIRYQTVAQRDSSQRRQR